MRRLLVAGSVLLVVSLLLAFGLEGRAVTPDNRLRLVFGAWLGHACLLMGVACCTVALVLRERRPAREPARPIDWYG